MLQTTYSYIDLDYMRAAGLQARYYIKAYHEDGSVISTTNTVTTSVASWKQSIEKVDSNPSSSLLLQNYPNPFNPTTKIKYSLSQSSPVTLKIYDSFGRDVMTLVNEVKTEGVHEREFDASNLASGIYFYQLKTNSVVDTRKMMLIK